MLTPLMEWALDSFQHRVAQRLTGRHLRRRRVGSWAYPPLGGSMGEAGSGKHSQGGIKLSCSILRRNQFWTSVSGPLGGQEQGCIGSGGNSPA